MSASSTPPTSTKTLTSLMFSRSFISSFRRDMFFALLASSSICSLVVSRLNVPLPAATMVSSSGGERLVAAPGRVLRLLDQRPSVRIDLAHAIWHRAILESLIEEEGDEDAVPVNL